MPPESPHEALNATVRSIWIGPPKEDDSDVNGFFSIIDRENGKGSSFQFFCLREYKAAFVEKFNKKYPNHRQVQVRAVEDYLDQKPEDWELVQELYDLLLTPPRGNVRDRVTFKELFCLLLLCEGGYVLDTSVSATGEGEIAFERVNAFYMPLLKSTEELLRLLEQYYESASPTTRLALKERITEEIKKLIALSRENKDIELFADVWTAASPEGKDRTPEAKARTKKMLLRFCAAVKKIERDYPNDLNGKGEHSERYKEAIIHQIVDAMLLTDDNGVPDLTGLRFWTNLVYVKYGYPVLLDSLMKIFGNSHGAKRGEISAPHYTAAAQGDTKSQSASNTSTITTWDGEPVTPLDLATRYSAHRARDGRNSVTSPTRSSPATTHFGSPTRTVPRAMSAGSIWQSPASNEKKGVVGNRSATNPLFSN